MRHTSLHFTCVSSVACGQHHFSFWNQYGDLFIIRMYFFKKINQLSSAPYHHGEGFPFQVKNNAGWGCCVGERQLQGGPAGLSPEPTTHSEHGSPFSLHHFSLRRSPPQLLSAEARIPWLGPHLPSSPASEHHFLLFKIFLGRNEWIWMNCPRGPRWSRPRGHAHFRGYLRVPGGEGVVLHGQGTSWACRDYDLNCVDETGRSPTASSHEPPSSRPAWHLKKPPSEHWKGWWQNFSMTVQPIKEKHEIEELLNNFAQQIGAGRFCLYFLSITRNDYVMMYSLMVFENKNKCGWSIKCGFGVPS